MYYKFKKKFNNLESAIDAVLKVSDSLCGSDFYFFIGCKSICEIEYKIRSNYLQESWGNFGVKYYKRGWWAFSYETYTGKNEIVLESRNYGEEAVYAYYIVESYSGFFESTAVKSALSKGWQAAMLDDVNWSYEDLVRKRQLLAKKQQLRKHGPNLEMHFDVHFEEMHGLWHVLSHSLHTDVTDDVENVKLVPELASQFKALAEAEIDREFISPEYYEYNELVRKGGGDGFYDKKFREYQTGLRKLIAVCEELEKSTPQVEVQLTEPKPKRAPRKPRAERRPRD